MEPLPVLVPNECGLCCLNKDTLADFVQDFLEPETPSCSCATPSDCIQCSQSPTVPAQTGQATNSCDNNHVLLKLQVRKPGKSPWKE